MYGYIRSHRVGWLLEFTVPAAKVGYNETLTKYIVYVYVNFNL